MAGEAPEYLKWIRSLHCYKCGAEPPNEAHHRTGAGMAQRNHDHDAMPLCLECHRQLHGLSGRFKHYTKETLRAFQDGAIQHLRARWYALRRAF